jgi:murein DD-endopeptidase MepM/ murein hydrolase activator NlpD
MTFFPPTPQAAASFALLLLASCIEVKDRSDSAVASAKIDTGSGSLAVSTGRVDSTPATTAPKIVGGGPDSVPTVRSLPPDVQQALSRDTTSTLRAIDSTPATLPTASNLDVLRREMIVPVVGIAPSALHDSYDELRGGTRKHEALDILAARGTPIVSAAPGRILKLFDSKAGGLMVYAADSTDRFILMYAHLDAYQPGLAEGQRLARGQPLGTVGTSGNAPANVPHLHFAIASSSDVRIWWKGAPVNPYPLLVGR